MKNAKRYGGVTKDGAVFVHVKDNGDDVHVTRDGLRHGLDRRKQVNAPVTMKVGEVLSNAIEINELNPRDLTRTQETKVLIGAAKNQNNEPYIALFVVNRTTGQLEDFDTLYSVNAKTSPQNKKKSAGSLSPGSGQIVPASLTDSDINIAGLLQYVNKYFPDVLPEEVLKHFGHSSRPEGKLGASALFQKWGIGETAEEREARKESISNLKTENSILRARAKYWRDQTRQTRERTVRQQDTDRMANDLLREYESRKDKAEIKSDLKALGDYLVQAEELDYEELHDRAEDITFLTALWGWVGWAIAIFIVAMFTDYITGTLAARANNKWSSAIARQGLWHKLGEITALLVAALCDIAVQVLMHSAAAPLIGDFKYGNYITLIVAVWYIFTELGSIIENAGKLGATIPE